MDKINIKGLRESFKVGHFDEERLFPQMIELDLEIVTNFDKAITSSDLNDTIDYTQIVSKINIASKEKEWVLLENLVHDLAILVLNNFSLVDNVKIKATKNIIENAREVSVEHYANR